MIFTSPIEKKVIFILHLPRRPLLKASRPPWGSRPPGWESLMYPILETIRYFIIASKRPVSEIRNEHLSTNASFRSYYSNLQNDAISYDHFQDIKIVDDSFLSR